MRTTRSQQLFLGLALLVLNGSWNPAPATSSGLAGPSAAQKTKQATPDLQIFKDPEPVDTCLGEAVSFTVVAYPKTATYVWRKDGAPLVPAQTGPTLNLGLVDAADAGSYDVVVSLGQRARTSAAATLTVREGPTITVQPSPAVRTVNPGVTIVYSVTASGSGPLSYQWRKRPVVPFAPWENVPGATSSTLVLENVTGNEAGSYRCLVTDECGTVRSNQVQLRVL